MTIGSKALIALGLLATLTTLQLPALAGTIQPLETLASTVHGFLTQRHRGDEATVRVDPPDRRLRLALCTGPLEAFLPPGARGLGNTTVGVRCANPAWTVYLSARVQVYDQVLVAARYLQRGAVLSGADLTRERRDLTTLHGGYLTDPQRALGLELRRSLQPGTVIAPRTLEAPLMVRRGEQVTLSTTLDGLVVTAAGTALGDGALGERLRVRAPGRVVEGTVIGPRQVDVGP